MADKMQYAKLYILGSIGISLISIVLSTNTSFAVSVEENDGDTNSKDPLATIVNSKDYFTNMDKGNELFDKADFDQAITYYDKVLSIDPDSNEALFNKATALGHLGKYEEAVTYYDKVLAIDPDNADAQNGKEFTLSKLGANGFNQSSSVASKKTFNKFKDPKTGLSFEYTSDWEVASDEYLQSIGAPENLVVLMIPKSIDASTMSVAHRELHYPISEEFVESIKKSIVDNGSTVGDIIPISTRSLDGYEFNVTATDNTQPAYTQVILAKDLETFMVTYGVSKTDKQENRDIESMIDSFKIEDDVSKNDTSSASLAKFPNVISQGKLY